jgi:hypothetical protein
MSTDSFLTCARAWEASKATVAVVVEMVVVVEIVVVVEVAVVEVPRVDVVEVDAAGTSEVVTETAGPCAVEPGLEAGVVVVDVPPAQPAKRPTMTTRPAAATRTARAVRARSAEDDIGIRRA